MAADNKPPATLKIVWCPVCGRTDRPMPLKPFPAKHNWQGKPCPGKPYELLYEFLGGRP